MVVDEARTVVARGVDCCFCVLRGPVVEGTTVLAFFVVGAAVLVFFVVGATWVLDFFVISKY